MASLYHDLVLRFAAWPLKIRESLSSEVPSFRKPPHFRLASKVIDELITAYLEVKEDTPKEEVRYFLRNRKIVEEAVAQIREKRDYQFFLYFIRAIETKFNLPFPEYLPDLLESQLSFPALLFQTLVVIWMLLEKKEEGRFPVIVQDGTLNGTLMRKRFILPEDPKTRANNLFSIGMQILTVLPFLDEEDFDLIPEQFAEISLGDPTKQLHLPIPIKTVEEVLEDAEHNQRYFVPPVGAGVKIEEGGDIIGGFVKVKGRVVISKFRTLKGEILCLLDLETGKGANFIRASGTDPKDFLSRILANVYHALVVAKEKPSPGRPRAEEIPLAGGYPLEEGEMLSISYIPRAIYVWGKEKGLPSQRGTIEFRRPLKPRPVRPYFRLGEMSDHQREIVGEIERSTGVKILDKLPPGKTYVKFHYSPCPQAGEVVTTTPVYIKKGTQAELIGVQRMRT